MHKFFIKLKNTNWLTFDLKMHVLSANILKKILKTNKFHTCYMYVTAPNWLLYLLCIQINHWKLYQRPQIQRQFTLEQFKKHLRNLPRKKKLTWFYIAVIIPKNMKQIRTDCSKCVTNMKPSTVINTQYCKYTQGATNQ